MCEFAKKKQQMFKTVVLSGSGAGEERMARKTLQEGMADVNIKFYTRLGLKALITQMDQRLSRRFLSKLDGHL